MFQVLKIHDKRLSVKTTIQGAVDQVNPTQVRVETVRRFTTPPKKPYEEDGEATPTKKVKRKYVNDAYQDLIEAMYR